MIVRPTWLRDPALARLFAGFERAGFDLFCVGGCVRNAVMGAPVGDIDLSTPATPEQVSAIGRELGANVVPTGIDHGTVTLVLKGKSFEITTFRKDVETDGRRAVVAFSTDMREDAIRRDFTMNALYMTLEGQVIDPLGGMNDAINRRVRFIENPMQRIREDYLRILRFFRFYAWYGDAADGIDADGLAACAELAEGLAQISKERIGVEVLKTLSAADPMRALGAMDQSGVLRQILAGSSLRALGPLVELTQSDAIDPLARLALMGEFDLHRDLRLSKAQTKRVDQIRSAALCTEGPLEIGYRHGELAASILKARAALLEVPFDPNTLELARQGSGITFPLSGGDLIQHYKGAALGHALKTAEAHWLAHEGAPARQDLLDWLAQRD